MREELARLRTEMLRVDATTEEGQRKMAALEKQYKDTSSALRGLAESAAQEALEMKNGVLGAEDAAVSLINTLQRGESVINGVFSSIKDQVDATNQSIQDSGEILNATLEEMQEKLVELTRERNLADAAGDSERVEELNDEIQAVEENIKANTRLHESVDSLNEAYKERLSELDEAMVAYEELADQQSNVVDLTEEEANAMQKQLQEALDNVLEKISNLQDVTGEMPDMLNRVKEAATQFRGGVSETIPKISELTKGEQVLGKASIDLAKNIAKIVLPANAAKVAVAALSGGLATAGVAVATILIKKLVEKYKEQKQAAEEARQAQEEFNKEVSKGAAPAIQKFEELRSKWGTLKTDMEKNDFLRENATELKKLGLAVDSVDDAEQLWISHTQDYWDAQVQRAKADAYRAKITEKIAERLRLEEEMEQHENDSSNARFGGKNGWEANRSAASTGVVWTYNKEKDPSYQRWLVVNQEISEFDKKAQAAASEYNNLMSQLPGGKEGDAVFSVSVASAKKTWQDAKNAYDEILNNATATEKEVKAKRQALSDASKAYKDLTGISPEDEIKNAEREAEKKKKLSEDERKRIEKDEEAKKQARQKAIESYEKQIVALIQSTEDSITQAEINAIDDNQEKVIASLKFAQKQQLDKAKELGQAMTELFKGNVDLLNRPNIPVEKLIEKGWEDAGNPGDYATVFSQGYGFHDNNGAYHELLVTPILPDGSVLSQQELEDYLDRTMEGAEDFLQADEKGIVIAVDVDEDAGEKLHEMQEQFYGLIELIKQLYALLTSNAVSDFYKSIYESIDEDEDGASGKIKKLEDEYNKTQDQLVAREKQIKEQLNGELTEEERKRLEDELALNKDKQEELLRIFKRKRATIEMESGKLAKAMGSPYKMTIKEISESLDTLHEALGKDGRTAEDLKTIQDQIDKLFDSLFNLSPKGFLTNVLKNLVGGRSIMDIFADLGKAWSQASPEAKTKAVAGSVSIIASGLQSAVQSMKYLAELTGDSHLAEQADELAAVTQNFSAAAEGAAESGSWIGAVVGGVVDMLTQTVSSIEQAKNETVEMANNARDFAHAMQMAALTLDESDYSSIFGTDNSGKMKGYAQKMKDSIDAYQAELKNLETTQQDYYEQVNTSTGMGVFGGPLIGQMLGLGGLPLISIAAGVGLGLSFKQESNEFKTYKDAIAKGYNELQAMAIKTKDNSGWANFWGVQDEFTALGDLAPELWGEDGVFSVEKARQFLDINTQLSEEQRTQIQNMIDMQDAADKAEAALRNALSSIFGDMSSQLADATIEGLTSGAEMGSYEMKRILSGSVKDLEKQMVQGIYSQYLKKYEDDAFKLLQNGGNEEDLVGLYSEMIDNIGTTVSVASAAAQHFEDIAREKGFELDEISNEDGSRGSYQNITETTGSAIEGRMASLQMSVAEMLILQREGVNLERDIRDIHADAYLALVAIRNNTGDNLAQVKEIKDLVTNIELKTRNL